MIGEVTEPQSPWLLTDLPSGGVPVLIERLEELEGLGQPLSPDAGRVVFGGSGRSDCLIVPGARRWFVGTAGTVAAAAYSRVFAARRRVALGTLNVRRHIGEFRYITASSLISESPSER
jgi:hypothetical protein